MKTASVIGRSRTGDQLHLCTHLDYEQPGRKAFISANAHCNQRMKLRPLSGFRDEQKVAVKMRAGLFCIKCFGEDASRIAAREYFNATVECSRRWRITGTNRGVSKTVEVTAANHNDAVRAGSHAPHMLVVQSCVLID